jgi:beta-galactosidase
VWDEDVALMRQAGWNIATLPVFGWASLQSDEETFHFEWLDRVLDKLHAGGIGACMATATASVPAWVAEEYPDVLVTGPHGQVIAHGGRHIFCPNSPNFRRLSTALVRKIAERYAAHPALRIWHISNEYGGNNSAGRCYCPRCAKAFQDWLEQRYGTLENLNHRWDTPFWGKVFTRWTQIQPPFEWGERSIQALRLDFDRFQSESLLNCYRAEAAVLREVTPNIPITTNLMGAFKPLDYHAWAREMDIVGWDCYPGKEPAFSDVAFNHALMRGLKEGQPWLLMEQTPSQANWQQHASLKRPGILRLWSYQAVAHGADSVMYFQWRRTRGGNEKFHGAVVEHAGTSETRVFREVAELGRELAELGTHTVGGRVPAKVAILFDWENWWAVEYSSGPNRDLQYVAQCRAYYAALHEQGIVTDVVSPAADLSKYSVVIAPTLYMVKAGIAEKLEDFVQAGGTLLTTFFSGVADECDSVHLGGYPGPLRKLLGIWVEEVDALSPAEKNSVEFVAPFGEAPRSLPCGLICERVHLEGAEELAVFGHDFYAGEPVFTRHQYGEGKAYYLASALDAESLRPVLREICSIAGVLPVVDRLPEGLEIMLRVAPDGTVLWYLLNHSKETLNLPLPPGGYRDLLTGQSVKGEIWLPALQVAILVAD